MNPYNAVILKYIDSFLLITLHFNHFLLIIYLVCYYN
jgi:hypothetical protein